MAKCDDALNAYNALILDGMDIESKVAEDCQNRRDWTFMFLYCFAIWAAVSGQALLCQIMGFRLALCDALFVIALALLIMMILLLLALIAATIRLRENKKKCRAVNQSLANAFNKVTQDCPKERWPAQLYQAKCKC